MKLMFGIKKGELIWTKTNQTNGNLTEIVLCVEEETIALNHVLDVKEKHITS